MAETDEDEQPALACSRLLEDMQTMQLSTVGEDGSPHCGYTPYLHSIDKTGTLEFHIFVSQLAAHTRDMLANDHVAIMIIADESSAKQVFARVRVSYHCKVQQIPKDDAGYEAILDAYQARHGKMAGLLRQLPDFVLFRLMPVSGQFVMGFGKAFKLAGDQLQQFEHTRTG